MENNWERKSEPRTGKTWREGRGLEEDEMNPAKIVARNRAIGLIPPELDGAIGSIDLPVYIADNEMLHQDYIT